MEVHVFRSMEQENAGVHVSSVVLNYDRITMVNYPRVDTEPANISDECQLTTFTEYTRAQYKYSIASIGSTSLSAVAVVTVRSDVREFHLR